MEANSMKMYTYNAFLWIGDLKMDREITTSPSLSLQKKK